MQTISCRILSIFLAFLCLAAMSHAGMAGAVPDITVKASGGRYHLYAQATIKGDRDDIFTIITDYPHMKTLNPSVVESRVVTQESQRTKVFIRLSDCVLFFCREIRNTQWVRSIGHDTIIAETIPAESNLRYGETIWRLEQEGTMTHVTLDMTMEPDFLVPPLIGTAVLQHKMYQQATRSIRTLEERLAAQNSP